jgi:hypothetical protein
MTIKLLDTGYVVASFDMNRFIQWPQGRPPRPDDGFGWLTPQDFVAAERAAASLLTPPGSDRSLTPETK